MEENYKLEKEYSISGELFREAYREFQKLYILPENRIVILLCAIAAIAAAVLRLTVVGDSEKLTYLMYLIFVTACAVGAKKWYDPNKVRESLTRSVQALGEPIYKIGVGDGFADISTVSDDESNMAETEEDEQVDDPLPEKTRLTVNEEFRLHEYERFFLLVPDKSMLYILPKKGFAENELQTLRTSLK